MSSAADAAVFDALPEGPARVLTLALIPGGNDDDLGGVVCQEPRACVAVPYPYLFRSVGVADLNNALISGAPERQIIFGYSQGARVAAEWLEEHGGTEGAPTPDELSFVLIGNPGRKYGGANVALGQATPTDTDYDILDVSRQYDGASDLPDRFNLLAIANALMGFSSIHTAYEDVDLYAETNYVWTEGNTTYVFVPTENLPLLDPLRWLGLTGLADSLNGPLKAMIESAYDRSYLPAEPGLPPVEPEPDPEPEQPPSEPDPEPEQLPSEPDPEPEQLPSEDALMASRTAVDEHDAVTPAVVNTEVQPQTEPDSQDIDEDDLDALDEDGATEPGQEDGDEGDNDPALDADADADGRQDDSEGEGDDGPASSQERDTQQKSSASSSTSSDGDDAPKRKERSDSGE